MFCEHKNQLLFEIRRVIVVVKGSIRKEGRKDRADTPVIEEGSSRIGTLSKEKSLGEII